MRRGSVHVLWLAVSLSVACGRTGLFDPDAPGGSYALTLSSDGNGTGLIESIPPGISCPGQCEMTVAAGTTVTLMVTSVESTSRFLGWSGDCSGTDTTCEVLIDAQKSATFSFGLRGTPAWVMTAGSIADDVALAIDSGPDDVVVVGSVGGPTDFGDGPVGTDGTDDVFLARFDSQAKLTWASAWGSSGSDRANGVVLASDEVVLVGACDGDIDFGGGSANAGGGEDVCVACLTRSDGQFLWDWYQDGGTNNDDEGTDVTLDSSGGPIGIGTANVFFAGQEVGLAHFDPAGQHLDTWVSSGQNGKEGLTIAGDGAGGVYVGGNFSGDISFGNGSTSSNGGDDAFLTRIDETNGDDTWGGPLRIGEAGNDSILGVASTAGGSVVAVGYFEGQGVDIGGASYDSKGGTDIFVIQLDPTGQTVELVATFGSTGDDFAEAVAVDPEKGEIVVVGSFTGTIAFGTEVLDSAGGDDAFVLKLSPSGVVQWAVGYGGAGDDALFDVVHSDGSTLYAAGSFEATVDFGFGDVTSNGGQDIVLLRLAP